MTTQYPNQSVQYTDIAGNTATLTPDVGLVLSNGVTTLTMDQTGFTNGVQTLLFQDIYATVGKTESIKYFTSTPTSLNVQDTIVVDDIAGINTTTITPNHISFDAVGDSHETHIDNTQVHILDLVTNDEMFIDHNSLILVQPTTTHQTELLGNMLDFQTPENLVSCGHTTYQDGHPGFEAYDLGTGDSTLLGLTSLRITSGLTSNQTVLGQSSLSLTDGVTTNTLDVNNWSGNIQTVNTSVNATHYINFSDSSATGFGKPQKTTGITVNPSTKTVTATTFVGALTGASSSVLTTSDNTATTCYLPFIKTTAGASTPLYVDDTTGPLSYNPSTSVMSASYFSGDVIRPTTQNTATYSSPTLSISGASNGQSVSYRNSSIIFTGSSNTVSALTLTNMVINGTFNVMILNSGSGNLTFNTGLGTNIKTVYSSSVSIPGGRYGMLSINTIVVNSLTIYVVNVVVLTN
jgi:hypothetical protein